MEDTTYDVVICGAGIAGIAAAYHLTAGHTLDKVLLIDEGAPLSLTSDKSTECYRNWWPGPGDAMVRLMNRSIDVLETLAQESQNAFNLNRRGYLFATAEESRVAGFERAAEEAAALGAGALRRHSGVAGEAPYAPAPASGFENQPTGADLITDPRLIRALFPYLAQDTVAVLHARRCGWFSAQQLGMLLLDRAAKSGAHILRAQLTGVEVEGGRVSSVRLDTENGARAVSTHHLVIAAGPKAAHVARLIGVELPIYCELHAKVAFQDSLRMLPREAPLLIWTDPQKLAWTEEERDELTRSDSLSWLLDEFPCGVHARPEGMGESQVVLVLWTYHTQRVEPTFPPVFDPAYPEVALRGLARMIPGLRQYFGRLPRPIVDGGYYVKTVENRPLIGPLPVQGAWILGALSGFGLMAAAGAGELLAAHLTSSDLPDYERWFRLERYEDAQYRTLLETWGSTGQL